jgi:hypothetical protein
MRFRGLTLMGVLGSGACFDPSGSQTTAEPTSDTESSTDPSGDPTTDPSGDPTTDPSATTSPTTTVTSADSSTTTDATTDSTDVTTEPTTTESESDTDESSTGGVPIECGDGIEAPGELCFDDLVLIESNDVTYDGRLVDVDVDGDGDVMYMIGDQVVTHLGIGDGTFGPALFGVTVSPTGLEVGDIDGDDVTDIAILNEYENTLQIALGDSNGDFVLQEPPLAAGTTPRQIVVGDVDGEMGDDVLVAGASTLNVFLADGDGTPTAIFGLGIGGPVLALGIGELNGDGDGDIVYVASPGGNAGTYMRFGDGDGTFGSAVAVDVTGTATRATSIGDLDGDGNGDIVHVDTDAAEVYVLLGNGAGGFADGVPFATDTTPQQVVVVDLTSDGHLDVAVGHDADSLWIYAGDGAGGLGEPLQHQLAGPVDSLAWGSGNADGVPDLIATDTGNQHVTVVLSTP